MGGRVNTEPLLAQEPALASFYAERRAQTFPILTPEQIARLTPFGRRISVQKGQILSEPGERHRQLFVVLSGSIEVVRPTLEGEQLIVVVTPGGFTGEMSTLRGVSSLGRARVREDGELLAISDDNLRTVVQTDAALSELFMRAFILRRVALVTSKQGDVVLIGSYRSAGTLRIQQFLSRNAYPHTYRDVDTDATVPALLDRFDATVDDIPVTLCRGKVMRNPTNAQLADCLGMNPQIDCKSVRDVVVIGAGPAGLAAAVYAASEGLSVLVLETSAPGGQAGSSSRIENYLGFPTGISGQALAGRALVQAQKFGAEVTIANTALRLRCDPKPFEIELGEGHIVRGRSIVIASGVEYRKLDIVNLERFQGVGIYYAATFVEAQLCKGEEVIIVGGGNSAGQAAVFLAMHCKQVHLLVRATGLTESMSRYLIRRIEDTPNITLRTCTEIKALDGDSHLEEVRWFCTTDDESEIRPIRHIFLMTGAVPNTRWLEGCVALDDKGFVRTCLDLRPDDLTACQWSLPRPPYMFETSVPRIFAVGDVRCGSVKRVAAAVGEGSTCIQLVHRALAE